MKVYFYSNNKNEKEAQAIVSYLKRVGIKVMKGSSEQNKEKDLSKDLALSKIDALIIQASSLDAQAGYLIALALAQSKNVLCLLPEGKTPDSTLRSLKADKSFTKKLYIEFYKTDNLTEKVSQFLQLLDKHDMKELFNIKYTLRISRKINDYLNWKAKKVNMRKADWLRERVRELMKSDKEYQEFVKGKFKLKR